MDEQEGRKHGEEESATVVRRSFSAAAAAAAVADEPLRHFGPFHFQPLEARDLGVEARAGQCKMCRRGVLFLVIVTVVSNRVLILWRWEFGSMR